MFGILGKLSAHGSSVCAKTSRDLRPIQAEARFVGKRIADGPRSWHRCPRRVDFDAGFPEQFGAVTSFVLSCPEHLRSGSEYPNSFVLSVVVCKL